jgi:serine/threonine protein kinase
MTETEDPLGNYILDGELGKYVPFSSVFFLILNRGSFSSVYKAVHIETGETYAIKCIPKRFLTKQGWVNLQREVEILMNVKHPNLLRMKESIDSPNNFYLVTEL